mmetsp:Transcript_35196/g.84086  ORF Transcript_35196/g.84086 Transcript_35196/m.84086 type:complete len:202 (-) Transcript_35196:802-1407(-)
MLFVRALAGPALSSLTTASGEASWRPLFCTWRRTPTWWVRRFRTTCGRFARGSSFSASWIPSMASWIGRTSCKVWRCGRGCRPSLVRRLSFGGFVGPCAGWIGRPLWRCRRLWSCLCCCLRLLVPSHRWPWRLLARTRSTRTSRCRSRMLGSCRKQCNGGRSPSLVHRALGVASRSAVCRALLCTRRSLHRPSQALRVLRA